MHGRIAHIFLFQKLCVFQFNNSFLTKIFDDFHRVLHKNVIFSEKNGFWGVLWKVSVLIEPRDI